MKRYEFFFVALYFTIYLEHKLAYGLKRIVTKLVSLRQFYRFSGLVSYQVAF